MGAVPVEARPRTGPELAIGVPDLTEQSRTFQETILNASVPGLERFGIEASAAWRDRSMRPERRRRPARRRRSREERQPSAVLAAVVQRHHAGLQALRRDELEVPRALQALK